MTQNESAISQDDLKECWCCGGLHDSYRTLCPNCHEAGCSRFEDGCESDHQPVLADGGFEHPVCSVDGCETEVVGLDDGWEMSRGIVCQGCIDYHDRHHHWPDEERAGCRACHCENGGVVHECTESTVDAVLLSPGDECDFCEVSV